MLAEIKYVCLTIFLLNIKDLIKQYNFKENKDYETIRNVPDRQSGRTIYKTIYLKKTEIMTWSERS